MAMTLTGAAAFCPPAPLIDAGLGLSRVSLIRLPSGRVWRCDTGDHRLHRTEERARRCAWDALPMTMVSARTGAS